MLVLTIFCSLVYTTSKSIVQIGDKSSLQDSIQIIDNNFANSPFTIDYSVRVIFEHLPKIFSQSIKCEHVLRDSAIFYDSLCVATNGVSVFKYVKSSSTIVYASVKDNSVDFKFNLKIGDSRKSVCNKFGALKDVNTTLRKILISNNDGAPKMVILEFRDDKLHSVEFFPYDG